MSMNKNRYIFWQGFSWKMAELEAHSRFPASAVTWLGRRQHLGTEVNIRRPCIPLISSFSA